MWVRKTEAEYMHFKRRFWWAIGSPLTFALIMFPMFCFCFIFIGVDRAGQTVRPWPEAAKAASLASTLAFVGGYAWQVFRSRNLFEKTVWFCNKCHAVKNPDAEQECECGGTFEDMDRWKWVKDKES